MVHPFPRHHGPTSSCSGWVARAVVRLFPQRLARAAHVALAGCVLIGSSLSAQTSSSASGADGDAAVRARAGVALPAAGRATDARIGPNDLLEIVVLEAPELNRTVRVAGSGEISLPLIGDVRAAGLSPAELENAIERALRNGYIIAPHVSVNVKEMESRPISVVGAVARPGVIQLREPRSLLDVIALAGGLTKDAGDSVVVMRSAPGAAQAPQGAGGASADGPAVGIGLKDLLESGDTRHDVLVYPGDVVKVRQASVIYVVGEVRRPGAFALERRAGLTALQAIAMGEGLGPTAAKQRVTIIRTSDAGERTEIRVDLGRVVAGRAIDPPLRPNDVVFVPNNRAKAVTIGVVDALVRTVTLRGVF